MTHFIKNRGIGLIEVLITTLVVAVGLLAVAALQGNLMKSSGENKARAEAKTLCETKIEQLRDAIAQGTPTTAGTYNAIVSSTSATKDSITGTNETFTREWLVTPLTVPANHKQISVTCKWGNNDADHQVIVQSLLSFDDIAVSLAINDAATAASGSAGLGSPTTNAGSSDDVGQVKLPCSNAELIPFENGLYTRRVYYQGTGTFKEAIELFKQVGTECYRNTRYNGGVIIPIKGRLYSNISSSLSLSGFSSSEQGIFCTIDSSYALTSTSSLPYSCYVGGKCSSATAGTTYTSGSSTNTIVTQCPPTGGTYPTYNWVGDGGWRGRIGIKGLISGNGGNTVCFSDSSSSNTDTAREYFSLRNNSSVLTHEGINKPYLCHDFLVADSCPTTAGALNVANSLIKRTTTGISTSLTSDFSGTAVNTYDSVVNKSSCHVITGTVPSGVTTVGATTSNGGFDCTVTGTTYECIGTSKQTSVTVSATAGGTTPPLVVTLTPSTMTVPSMNLVAAGGGGGGGTTYTVSGTITYHTAVAADLLSILPASCSFTGGVAKTGYSCTAVASGTNVTVTFTDGSGANNRAICVGRTKVETTGGTIYTATASGTQNITLKKGNSIACP
ncbi:MAG: hypothetical protein EXR80_06850 [Methylococcales bacterium]|nr:hypothetical protein [Methylococcales bacterium]